MIDCDGRGSYEVVRRKGNEGTRQKGDCLVPETVGERQ